jgi:acylglycerol lipase
MYIAHTRVWRQAVHLRGTVAIVHGYGECSDIHLENAIQLALNGFDVQLIDLRGYGLSGGFRMSLNRIHDYHFDVTALLLQCSPDLPLYLYGHSMGGLTIMSYLLNNPNLNISGVVLSAPFLQFSESK